MKKIFSSKFTLSIIASIIVLTSNAQIYLPGHQAIELDNAISGLTIKNTRNFSTSALDLYSDNDRNVQLGIGNSTNTFVGPDVAYLFTPASVPLEFYTGGFRRMFISEDGKVGINAPNNFIELFYVSGDTKIENGDLTVNLGVIKGNNSTTHPIVGTANGSLIAGVFGENLNPAGGGVLGVSETGFGIEGISNSSSGIRGNSTSGPGVSGSSDTGHGVSGSSTNDYGVYGTTSSFLSAGVRGHGVNLGVNGTADFGSGMRGFCQNGIGVEGHALDNPLDGDDEWDFYASGSAMDWGTSSSIRWKENVVVIDQPLEKIEQLRGVYYDWIPEKGSRHDIGFIAEEVGEVIPEIVSYEKNGVDAVGMDYTKVTPLLVEAIKSMRQEYMQLIEELQLENAQLKERLDLMKNDDSND